LTSPSAAFRALERHTDNLSNRCAGAQVDVGLALLCWRDFTPADIIALKWSPVKPSLLFALDAHSTMFAFDLLEGTPNAPLFSESFAGASGARATSMDVSVSSAAMADAVSASRLVVVRLHPHNPNPIHPRCTTLKTHAYTLHRPHTPTGTFAGNPLAELTRWQH
jgi:hypothetical protein